MPGDWFGPGPLHKVVVSMDRPDLLILLVESQAVVSIEDYGAFAVMEIDENALGGAARARAAGLPGRDELDLMALNGFHFNGSRPLETIARMPRIEVIGDPLQGSIDATAGLYIVQFRGPVKDAWRAALDATGVTVIGFIPSNAYLVHAPPAQVATLEQFGMETSAVQFVGIYQPGFKLRPSLRRMARRGEAGRVPVVVQVANVPGSRPNVDFVAGRMVRLDAVRPVGPYINVQGDINATALYDIARNPHVVAIEPGSVRSRLDERQGQIIAGNVSGTGPTGPGYLSWLASKGFGSGQFGTFSINVVDDAPSLTGHPDIPNARVDFALNPSGQSASQAGHGFLNAHIIAGFNDQSGFPYEDGLGYNYGLGIAPWAHVGCTAIFGSGGVSATSYESDAYNAGARISSNSWGYQTFTGSPIPSYDSNAQEMDFIVRDARGSQSGNQEYSIVFSAANSGSSANTVTTPATAKNVLTVGASENQRQDGTHRCRIGNSAKCASPARNNSIRQVMN